MGMEVKLDAEAAASIAAAAIFESMTQDARDQVLRQAVQYLLTPEKDSRYPYGNVSTPLQKAFNSALSTASYQVVQEEIQKSPEVKQAILDILGPLIQGALTAQSTEHNTSLADTIGEAVGRWLAEQARKE